MSTSSSQYPATKNSEIRALSLANPNIKSGFAPAGLIVLDPTAPALQVSFGVSNVIQNIVLMLKMSSM